MSTCTRAACAFRCNARERVECVQVQLYMRMHMCHAEREGARPPTTRQPTTRHQPTYTQGNKCTHANVRRKGCCRHSQRCFLNDAQRKIRSVRIRQPTTRQPTTRPQTKTAFKWRALGKEKEGRRAGQKTQAPKTRHAKDSSQWRPGSTAAGVCETHAGEGGTARSPSRGDPPAKKVFF